jgi:hypothetical protein
MRMELSREEIAKRNAIEAIVGLLRVAGVVSGFIEDYSILNC